MLSQLSYAPKLSEVPGKARPSSDESYFITLAGQSQPISGSFQIFLQFFPRQNTCQKLHRIFSPLCRKIKLPVKTGTLSKSEENAMNEEKLLDEIYQNANTGIYSIDTLLPKVEDGRVTEELVSYRGKLGRIAQDARQMMAQKSQEPAETGAMSKMGIWTGVQMNTLQDKSSSHIADMVIRGNTIGITKMTREMGRASEQDRKSVV